jgi:hypothetical protein
MPRRSTAVEYQLTLLGGPGRQSKLIDPSCQMIVPVPPVYLNEDKTTDSILYIDGKATPDRYHEFMMRLGGA